MNEVAALEESLTLMRQLEPRPLHVQHVAHLAGLLFDGLASLQGLGSRERLLLRAAGLLHDIGHQYDFNGIGHHKESARLIREHPWQQFGRPDVEIIAQVARYHRRAMPDFKHEEFRALADPDRRTVQALAGLLRLADSLDRTHEQRIPSLRVEVRPNQVALHLETTGSIDSEIRAARIKSDLASLVWQKDFLFLHRGQEISLPSPRPDEAEPSP